MMNNKILKTALRDLALVAISSVCTKAKLLFNTRVKAHSPIYAIRADQYPGRKRDIAASVILAYNSYHYELLYPTTEANMAKSKELVKDYAEGRYYHIGTDFPRLIRKKTVHNKTTPA